jgi:hypothetical protein
MSRIVSFRGQLTDGAMDTIPLQTIRGLIGYKIVKFDVMGVTENENYEASIKIYSIQQAGATTLIDFSDNTLLAAALYHDYSTATIPAHQTIVFDSITFNQDIYVTYAEVSGSGPAINYYIELEQTDLAMDEATVATLKDIRNND